MSDQTISRPDVEVAVTINGRAISARVEPRVTLLDALRNHLAHARRHRTDQTKEAS